MKLIINRYSLQIAPETPQDEAFLEEVLCLMRDGDSVTLVRRNAFGLSCWGCAEAKEVEPDRTTELAGAKPLSTRSPS